MKYLKNILGHNPPFLAKDLYKANNNNKKKNNNNNNNRK